MSRLISLLILLLVTQILSAEGGESPERLSRNPFSPPAGLFDEKKIDPTEKKRPTVRETPLAIRKEALALRLNATLTGGGNPLANINGTMAGEGDIIQGFRILEIRGDSVVLERRGVHVIIPMDDSGGGARSKE